ncbi:MAG: MXAN_5187 C-terminal domain-containing protein [Polyangiaceae bacterium]
MIASRFWYGVLALLIGGATLLLYLAISMHDRVAARLVAEGLSADSQVVFWSLKNAARERAAQLIRFSANDKVVQLIAAANRGSSIPSATRQGLKAQLKQIASKLPEDQRFDAVFAVNHAGEVVAQVGYDQSEKQPDFELGGYSAVADALHGYVRDDTLVLDRVYRIVVRPVEVDVGQAPAGAIIGAQIVDDDFARALSEETGAAVAFYTNGRRQGMGAPDGFPRSGLDQIVTELGALESDGDYKDRGRSGVRRLGEGLSAVYARLPGEAWNVGAGYVVAREAPRIDGIGGVLSNADDKDKNSANLILIIGAIVGATGIGLLLSFLEHTMPLNAFRRAVRELGSGAAGQHLAPEKQRGAYRHMAMDINLALEKAAGTTGADVGGISFKQVFGDRREGPTMSAFGFPDGHDRSDGGPPSIMPEAPAPQPGFNPAVAAIPTPAAYGAQPATNHGYPAARPVEYAQDVDAFSGDALMNAPANSAEVDAHWNQVYQDFVRLKRDCGENVDGFTFERFSATLRKNREELRRHHGVSEVHFSAYVKAGKAALKAKPVRQ